MMIAAASPDQLRRNPAERAGREPHLEEVLV